MLFFWVTEFKPMLAVIAVLPILLVLLWVLGTMTLLGIPYNVITALITALSIGIGVDYTIHIIHRFTEEIDHGRSLLDATKTTLATTGSALTGSALTTALAFAVPAVQPAGPLPSVRAGDRDHDPLRPRRLGRGGPPDVDRLGRLPPVASRVGRATVPR